MKRIDMVRGILEKLAKDAQITATEVAQQLGTSRTNASSDLNRLCDEGIARKRLGRPVYYSLAQGLEKKAGNEFETFINNNTSLFHCGEQAKAAVLYPPHGMHILLLGETGVGKSMFAKLIFDYAKSQGRVAAEASFIMFNCADYANNPQFLLSQLFGTVKGAYTGAEKDKKGLIELANGGILFLDEVHRLPPEGQEMLFSFIDGGVFRRMGETDQMRTAQVMLVCATTENPESSLLQTFIRRIPMMISIPCLKERTIEERLHLISNFFVEEAGRLGNPIQVSVNTIRALLSYECVGNIGKLKADIQIMCAKAYSGYILKQYEAMQISSFKLPVHIRNGLFAGENRQQAWSVLSGITSRFITYDAQDFAFPLGFGVSGEENVYQIIEQRTSDMRRVGLDEDQIQRELRSILDDYYRQYNEGAGTGSDLGGLERFVGSEVLETVEKLTMHVSRRLNCVVKNNLRYGLAIHINNAINRIQQGKTIVNPRLLDIQRDYPDVFQVAKECMDIVAADFNIKFPLDEAGFLALFFLPHDGKSSGHRQVSVIVAAHGDSTATSMADVVNRLLGKDVVKGFDAPLEKNLRDIYAKIRGYLNEIPKLQEVLLLADMGSLAEFSYDLERDLNVRVKSFVLTSTLHVLEAGRKASLGYALKDVYEFTKRVNELVIPDFGVSTIKEDEKKLYILCLCTTGHGSAQVMLETLSSRLDLKNARCKIIAQQLTDKQDLSASISRLEETGRIICVVSAFRTDLAVQQFDIMTVINQSGIPAIQKIIDVEIVFLEMAKTLASKLTGLDGRRVVKDVRVVVERIEQQLGVALEDEMLIGICCHMGCMLERLKQGAPGVPYKNKAAFVQAHANKLAIIKAECEHLGSIYGVEIPTDEMCFIASFFVKAKLL